MALVVIDFNRWQGYVWRLWGALVILSINFSFWNSRQSKTTGLKPDQEYQMWHTLTLIDWFFHADINNSAGWLNLMLIKSPSVELEWNLGLSVVRKFLIGIPLLAGQETDWQVDAKWCIWSHCAETCLSPDIRVISDYCFCDCCWLKLSCLTNHSHKNLHVYIVWYHSYV